MENNSFDKNKIVKLFESCLLRTLNYLKKNIYVAIYEDDLKCLLFEELRKKPIFRKNFRVDKNTEMPLVHSEYYHICKSGFGRYDLAILDPFEIGKKSGYIDGQKVLIGCELKMKYYWTKTEWFRGHLSADASAFDAANALDKKYFNAEHGYVVFVHHVRAFSAKQTKKDINKLLKFAKAEYPSVKFYFLKIDEDDKKRSDLLIL